MGNFLNITILIPLLPLAAALFIFTLLACFNRTINRLTKPVSAIIGLSFLSSGFISCFYYFKKIEQELVLANLLKIFEKTNWVMHLNLLSEKIIIIFLLLMTILTGVLFYKLPRKKGYVSIMIILGLFSSLTIFSILLIDFSALI